MKQTFTIFALLFCLTSFSQTDSTKREIKQTDTVHVVMTVQEFNTVISFLEANIDSKQKTKEISDFLKAKAVVIFLIDRKKK